MQSYADPLPNSIKVTIVVSILGLFSLMAYNVIKPEDPKPTLLFEIDGCKVYSFTNENEKHYFARCPNGKSATTSAGGEHIITESV